MSDLLDELTMQPTEELDTVGMDPSIAALINPLMQRRKVLGETQAKQLADFNRLSTDAENAQAGGGTTAGQGIASVLVGLLPTLFAGAMGGKRAAGLAAGAGAQGINTYQALLQEQQKANLNRLLGLSRNSQTALAQTQRELTGIDNKAASLATQRQNQVDRLEQRAESDKMFDATRRLGIETNASLRQALQSKGDEPVSSAYLEEYEKAKRGEDPDLKKLTAKEAKALGDDVDRFRRLRDEDLKEEREARGQSGLINSTWKISGGKELEDQARAVGNIRSLLETNSNIVDPALTTQLARERGEKGVMTDQDIDRQLPSNVANKLKQTLNYITSGNATTLTKEQKSLLKDYLDNRGELLDSNITNLRDQVKTQVTGGANTLIRRGGFEDTVNSLGKSAQTLLSGKGSKKDKLQAELDLIRKQRMELEGQ